MSHHTKLRALAILLTLALIGFTLVFFCSGCITAQKCAQMFPPPIDTSEVKSVTVREVVHDTVLQTKVDTARVEVRIDCDSLGRARIVSTNTTNGSTARARVREERNDGVLHAIFDCVCDSQAIYFAWLTRDTVDRVKQTITKTYPVYVPADLTLWEKFKIAYGGWVMGAVASIIILSIAWWALKTYAKVQFPPLNFFK